MPTNFKKESITVELRDFNFRRLNMSCFLKAEDVEILEKAVKDKSKFVKKIITNKSGKKQGVWAKRGQKDSYYNIDGHKIETPPATAKKPKGVTSPGKQGKVVFNKMTESDFDAFAGAEEDSLMHESDYGISIFSPKLKNMQFICGGTPGMYGSHIDFKVENEDQAKIVQATLNKKISENQKLWDFMLDDSDDISTTDLEWVDRKLEAIKKIAEGEIAMLEKSDKIKILKGTYEYSSDEIQKAVDNEEFDTISKALGSFRYSSTIKFKKKGADIIAKLKEAILLIAKKKEDIASRLAVLEEAIGSAPTEKYTYYAEGLKESDLTGIKTYMYNMCESSSGGTGKCEASPTLYSTDANKSVPGTTSADVAKNCRDYNNLVYDLVNCMRDINLVSMYSRNLDPKVTYELSPDQVIELGF